MPTTKKKSMVHKNGFGLSLPADTWQWLDKNFVNTGMHKTHFIRNAVMKEIARLEKKKLTNKKD